MSAATFLKTFVFHPSQVGAIAPSSRYLADEMVRWFDWSKIRACVEYGPGTGVFTQRAMEVMQPGTKFFAIERSPELAALTRARCPQAKVYEDSVVNVQQLCQQEGIERVDAILCGLPWASFPEALQEDCLKATLQVMSDGGKFATFAYLQGLLLPAGQRFKRKLRGTFKSVEHSPTVWRNLPPAFIYRATK
jgi:phosphatidylethanolamine/phosphatidyl-N-methylethanolamine N-methyltransferase